MEEMIKRVALAIGTEDGHSLTEADYLNMARAAIQAMREPTPNMIAEGESAASFGIGKPTDDEAIPRIWQWMIESALSPSTRGE